MALLSCNSMVIFSSAVALKSYWCLFIYIYIVHLDVSSQFWFQQCQMSLILMWHATDCNIKFEYEYILGI